MMSRAAIEYWEWRFRVGKYAYPHVDKTQLHAAIYWYVRGLETSS